MEYPDFDPTPESAWRERHATLSTAIERTVELEIKAAESLTSARAEVEAIRNAAARGDEIEPDTHRMAQEKMRQAEADLLHHSDVKKRQELMRVDHDKQRRLARGLAHGPRVIFAIQELAAAGPEAENLLRALTAVRERVQMAKQVIEGAENAAYPLPGGPHVRMSGGGTPTPFPWPANINALNLRKLFGPLADKALAGSAESAAT